MKGNDYIIILLMILVMIMMIVGFSILIYH